VGEVQSFGSLRSIGVNTLIDPTMTDFPPNAKRCRQAPVAPDANSVDQGTCGATDAFRSGRRMSARDK
jgi:hypothetical protein